MVNAAVSPNECFELGIAPAVTSTTKSLAIPSYSTSTAGFTYWNIFPGDPFAYGVEIHLHP